ncbi:MAG: signal recognition particle-docking protein FtsY [Clostridiales bacterium]|nr:signal recognition particle-docking protein FtsY [Clostridiales bacterium]
MGLFNKDSWLNKLAGGLKKTKENITSKIDDLVKYYKEIDDEFYEELEMILISADIGVNATEAILNNLKAKVKEEKTGDSQRIHLYLRQSILGILQGCQKDENEEYPLLMLITGVNGVGKTTAIGKIANFYKKQGKTVMVAAADTFRAAAAEQLDLWAQKAGALIVRGTEGADPSSVVYDAIQSAKARKIDVLICDTAGRLHNKKNLMDELSKIGRIITKNYPEAKRQNMLVLDATTGQNALMQAKGFSDAVGIDGIILNKLDGTAKGGVAVQIAKEMNIPIMYIGVGEGIDDLRPFDAEDFAQNII